MADIKLHFKNESGKYECNYCRHVLAASTSTTRLRAHLIGAPNAGTKICPNVPDYVRISLGGINKRQKIATGYILPSPSSLPPVETEGMAEAVTTLVLPPNESGANNYFGNQGLLRFLPQQHTMPLQYVAHLSLGETSEGTIGLTEAVMPPNETSSNPHQIESGANNHYISSFSPELNNDFRNQGGVLQYMMSTHPNESGSDENLPLPYDMIGRTTQLQHQFTTEYLPPNESCSNLEPEAFPPTDLVTQDLRNCCLTVKADQHGVGDAKMVQQEVQMVEVRRYDVFLSFRGEDTRNSFMSHLYEALSSSRISTFLDYNLSRGANISPSLLTAIEESMISVIIFSKNYADSKWCLKELAKILQCRELNGQIVIPVFYGVDPSHVRKQIGKFGVAFDKLKERLREGEMDLNEVRYHLEEAANISGWNSHDIRPESELIRSIVGDILKKLNQRREVEAAKCSRSHTERLVGDAFKRNVDKIWSWMMDDQVLRVGIYGMGGVGKTTLMRHIQTRLKGQSSFEVYWVTVSQDFSIWKLQNLIAKKIGLNFSDKEDEVDRAEKLTQALQEKRKCVLILDDLWNYFDVEDVGIPVKSGGCMLVLTTRLLNVCQKMDCNDGNIIQVQALSRPEAWILFTKELGNYSTEVEQLAKFVAIECDGLPLGIRVMARAMKGIREVHSWRNALEELRESKLSEGHEMREKVFPVLKFSYLHLIDPALQKCLLYCALFPEDHKIPRDELIEYMIVEGIIDAKKSRRAEFDRGRTMLDTLVNACLLEGNTRDVWMHDLIRDMAIYELRERSNTLVEAGAQLKELPDVEEWKENLVCVSLMYNDIKVIPSGHTPRCPNLSTLLLGGNSRLRMIVGSFLKQFQKLKVLDLSSCTKIEELPVYVSDLVNLTALLLHECFNLSHVPSLAKLERLKKLDLSRCEKLKRMPEGVELLINLKHLDLTYSGIERIGSEMIPKLSRLQVLNLGKKGVPTEGKELGRLEKLESLECNFDDTKEWRKYLQSREKSQQSLNHYFFVIGKVTYGWDQYSAFFFGDDDWRRSSNGVYLSGGGSSSNDYVALPLPTDIQALIIENDLNGSLWDNVLALKHTTQLHFLRLDRCDGIARLVNAPRDNLCGLSEVEKGTATDSFATTPFLSNLISIEIEKCHKLKNLYPVRLLLNLQKIRVWDCSGMEEVFGTNQEGEQVGLNVPQLVILELWGLPELRSLYNGAITCRSLQQIQLVNCPKLERITFPLPQASLWRIRVYPKEWWESVQWGSANDKIHLESLAGFSFSSS